MKSLKKMLSIFIAAILVLQNLNVAFAENTDRDINFKEKYKDNNLRISIMSDTHVLPENMIGDNPDFQDAMNRDRKLFVQSEGIFNSAMDLIEKNDSEIILITGDLSKDGEYKSNEFVKDKLENWRINRESQGKRADYFVVPGNHDLNNYNAKDFSGGFEVDARRTDHEEFMDLFSNVYNGASLYKDSDEYAEYISEKRSKFPDLSIGQGYASYAKHIDMKYDDAGRNGLTVIGLDTTINTREVTPDGKDVQITDGMLSQNLYRWAEEEIEKAKDRNDVIFILAHHGFIPHFEKEPVFLAPYLIREWDKEIFDGKTSAEAFADLGVSYIFTGHMHAQDIAKLTTDENNTIYDIETGSAVTYPNPIRHLVLKNGLSSESTNYSLDVRSENIKRVVYRDLDGETKTIEDLESISKGNLLTSELIVGLSDYFFTKELYKNLENNLTKTVSNMLTKGEVNRVSDYVWGKLPEWAPKIEDAINKSKPGYNARVRIEGDELKISVTIVGQNIEFYIKRVDISNLIENILLQIQRKLQNHELIKSYVSTIAPVLLNAKVNENVTVSDLANYSYLEHLKGDESLSPEMGDTLNHIKEYGVVEILKQIEPEIAKVSDSLLLDIHYDPKPKDIVKHKTPIIENIISSQIEQFVGSTVAETLVKLGKSGTPATTKEIVHSILSGEMLQNGLKTADEFLVDVVLSMTTESQDSYKRYAYIEDNNTEINWETAGVMNEFEVSIDGQNLTVSSFSEIPFTGKIIQNERETDLVDNSGEFEYNEPFVIEIERKLKSGYTQVFISDEIMIEENENPSVNTDEIAPLMEKAEAIIREDEENKYLKEYVSVDDLKSVLERAKDAASGTEQDAVDEIKDELEIAMKSLRRAKDRDEDGISDHIEKEIGTDYRRKDTDRDGISDLDELLGIYNNGKPTDPKKKDTDGDGFSDFIEYKKGSDATDPESVPAA